MSGAERAEKKRRRALLFPEKAAELRKKDAERKRMPPADVPAEEAAADVPAEEAAAAAAVHRTLGHRTLGQAAINFEDIYLDIASIADELDGTKAAGATADEWRERAAKSRSAKLIDLEHAEAVQDAVITAWNAARQAGREDAEAADRRGETWWRDLWKAEGMCEAWQGPLPPYMSTVCTCCSDTVLMYMNQSMSS